MIETFRHGGLQELFETGRSSRVGASLHRRVLVRLDAIDSAQQLDDLRQPGFDFHGLQGNPQRYSIHVNGPWCITFEWEDGNARRIDLVQYH